VYKYFFFFYYYYYYYYSYLFYSQPAKLTLWAVDHHDLLNQITSATSLHRPNTH